MPPLTLDASLGRAATAATPPATTTLVDTIAGVPPGQQQTSILQYMRTSSRYSDFKKQNQKKSERQLRGEDGGNEKDGWRVKAGRVVNLV